jgi:Mg/Co/Ni transporter MgtE
VIGAAMVINNLVAGLAGIMVPVSLDRLKVDPAVSSAVFVTMATDVMGFFSFLGLAGAQRAGVMERPNGPLDTAWDTVLEALG